MSLVTDLPAIFDQFSEARQKDFLTVMDLKSAAFRWLALTATFMPQEIPMAAGGCGFALFHHLMKPLKKRRRSAAQPLPAD